MSTQNLPECAFYNKNLPECAFSLKKRIISFRLVIGGHTLALSRDRDTRNHTGSDIKRGQDREDLPGSQK